MTIVKNKDISKVSDISRDDDRTEKVSIPTMLCLYKETGSFSKTFISICLPFTLRERFTVERKELEDIFAHTGLIYIQSLIYSIAVSTKHTSHKYSTLIELLLHFKYQIQSRNKLGLVFAQTYPPLNGIYLIYRAMIKGTSVTEVAGGWEH